MAEVVDESHAMWVKEYGGPGIQIGTSVDQARKEYSMVIEFKLILKNVYITQAIQACERFGRHWLERHTVG